MAYAAQKKQLVQTAADHMTHYEVHKGPLGALFGYEARDGILSKAAKTALVVGAVAGAGFLGFAAVPAGGLALTIGAGAAAVGGGMAGLILGRGATQKLFHDMHDNKATGAGKFGYLLGTGLTIAVGLGVAAGLATAGLSLATGAPLLSLAEGSALAQLGSGITGLVTGTGLGTAAAHLGAAVSGVMNPECRQHHCGWHVRR
jgi:hypothetical protein